LSVTWGRSVISPGTPDSSTNKTDHHDIAEILLKVEFNTITLTQTLKYSRFCIDNIFVLFGGRDISTDSRHSNWYWRYPSSHRFVSLYSYDADFTWGFLKMNENKLSRFFNSTFCYIDNVLSLTTKNDTLRQKRLFNFPIINFQFMCSNIPAAPAYEVWLCPWIRKFQSLWYTSGFPW
jgi:hypothetical protein